MLTSPLADESKDGNRSSDEVLRQAYAGDGGLIVCSWDPSFLTLRTLTFAMLGAFFDQDFGVYSNALGYP
jgi:hypothetical protein